MPLAFMGQQDGYASGSATGDPFDARDVDPLFLKPFEGDDAERVVS